MAARGAAVPPLRAPARTREAAGGRLLGRRGRLDRRLGRGRRRGGFGLRARRRTAGVEPKVTQTSSSRSRPPGASGSSSSSAGGGAGASAAGSGGGAGGASAGGSGTPAAAAADGAPAPTTSAAAQAAMSSSQEVKRSAGSLAMPCAIASSRAGGTPGRARLSGSTSAFTCAHNTAAGESRSNGGVPVTHW